MQRIREHAHQQRGRTRSTVIWFAIAVSIALIVQPARAQQVCPNPTPVPPQINPDTGLMCHPSACTPNLCSRGDIFPLSTPETQALQDRLTLIDCSPHTVAPLQVFAEADTPESAVPVLPARLARAFSRACFTTKIPGINDDPSTMRTVVGSKLQPRHHRIGSTGARAQARSADRSRRPAGVHRHLHRHPRPVRHQQRERLVRRLDDPRPARSPRRHSATLTDTRSSARSPRRTPTARQDGQRQQCTPGNFFTVDGKAPHFPRPDRSLPRQGDQRRADPAQHGRVQRAAAVRRHSYWEFNYTTNWIHPLYELPFTGGFPDHRATEPADTYQRRRDRLAAVDRAGQTARARTAIARNAVAVRRQSRSPARSRQVRRRRRRAARVPRALHPERHRAARRFLNAFERLASFEPWEHDLTRRLLDGYRAAIALVDTNGDGIISAAEGDIDTPNPGCPQGDNTCIFLLPRTFNRFAVTREINDGLLAPRFAPSTRGWVLSGNIVTGFPAIPASEGRDSDDR